MVDWLSLSISTLWILGLSLLLATISIAYWASEKENKPCRHVLSQSAFHLSAMAGVFLFAFGILLTVSSWWERAGWAAVLILALIEGGSAWKDWHTRPMKDSE